MKYTEGKQCDGTSENRDCWAEAQFWEREDWEIMMNSTTSISLSLGTIMDTFCYFNCLFAHWHKANIMCSFYLGNAKKILMDC